jgi:hypothetical protein
MRAIVLLFLVVFGGTVMAVADPISVSKGGADSPSPAPPTSIRFELARSAPDATVGFLIDNVTLADRGRVWTIHQMDAAD